MLEYRFPVYRPFLTGLEKEYVNKALDSTWISSKGEFIDKFEKKFSAYIGTKHAISVSNGTTALHLALLSQGIGPGDEVLVPTFTYIASVNAITYVGAKPIFVDCDETYWQICPNELRKKITKSTKAIIVVHVYGHPADMNKIQTIAEEFDLKVIEDCAEALGSEYKAVKVGNFGSISTFSFFGNKTITTGEGGMIVTNDDDLANLCKRLKGQGLSQNKEYWHDIIGYNYRMTNICAAIGLAQIEFIDKILRKKKTIAGWYKHFFERYGLKVNVQPESDTVLHSYWMVVILVDIEIKDELRNYLAKCGIETRPGFYPINTMPIYNDNQKYDNAENISKKSIVLPSYPDLNESHVELIVKSIHEFYSKYTS